MVEEEGVKKFLWDSCLFSLLIDFVILVIHLIFPQTILRLEIKMTNCADYQWYVWLKKMNIETTQYVYHEFQKRRVAGLHARGQGVGGEGYQEGRMIPLFKLCWCAIWFLQSDETNCFLLIHSLMRSNLQKNPFQRFSLSSSQLCSFFPTQFFLVFNF